MCEGVGVKVCESVSVKVCESVGVKVCEGVGEVCEGVHICWKASTITQPTQESRPTWLNNC